MWFQSCSWGGMLEKKQVEMNFCLVGHGSAVPLNYLDPGEKLLSSAGFQSFAASSAWKNCDKEKKGEQVLQREEPGIDDCFCWAVPSQCEAESGCDPLELAPSWGCSSGTAGIAQQELRPGKSLDEQGSPHRLYLARGHSKFCIANMIQGFFSRQFIAVCPKWVFGES